jgi:rhamnogalacturonyl hydrolase YesR
MERVADWQIAHQIQVTHHDLDWTNAALYIGMAELAAISQDTKYERWLLDIGGKYRFQPHHDMYLADDLAVSQMYLDLYRKTKDKHLFNPTQARTEWVVRHPSTGSLLYNGKDRSTLERWSWCDALFMAPPVYAQMYSITGDRKYLKFMDKEFRATADFLYDKDEKLFYRDHNYFERREANGRKVFWGRGNGWVVGGLVKVLKELPGGARSRKFYERLLVEMGERVAGLQDPDGYWHASLLDPEAYPNPETSGSGFFVYGLAYGVRTGLLAKDKYLPVVLKGWAALEQAVFPDGKLGWVQPIGSNPRQTTKDMTEVYGVGAFLLAGSEIYRLAD